MAEKYIELETHRLKDINAYLVKEGEDHTKNMYGTPIDDKNKEISYKKKRHIIRVRIDNLPDGKYIYKEAGGLILIKLDMDRLY